MVAAVRGQPIPANDPSPTKPVSGPTLALPGSDQPPTYSVGNVSSRSPSFTSDSSANLSPSLPTGPAHASGGPPWLQAASATPPFRPRSKTLASLTSLARNRSQDELIPQEIQLPASQQIDGRPFEAILYRDVTECPICFLYYPPYLNRTRCCDQPICSECFVQIKRPNPHPPEHSEHGEHLPATPGQASMPTPTSDSRRGGGGNGDDHGGENVLISEPATCPFCVQPDFGVTYDPPPFRSGLTYANHRSVHALSNPHSAMSSSSSLASFGGPGHGPFGAASGVPRRRTTSISASSPAAITTDVIRPDWSQKLANARAHAARRSAAATALHTAAYLMGGFSGEGRSFAGFGRRNRLVRSPRPDGTTNTSPLFSSLLRDRESSASEPRARASERDEPSAGQIGSTEGSSNTTEERERSGLSSRRRRLEDLEEMMMMEAIRMSRVEEEERKRKEEARAAADAATTTTVTNHGPHQAIATSIAAGPHRESGRHVQETNDASPSSGAGKAKAVDWSSSSPMSPPSTHLAPNGHSSGSSDAERNPRRMPSNHTELKGAMSPAPETGPSMNGLVLPNEAGRTSDSSTGGGSAETKFSFGSLTAMIESDGEADDGRILSPLDGSTAQLRGH